ncbi:MAG: hypothetical protein GEU79_11380 [Acidimicrobiia bacterium]|nr:hypothetical protein [Acidimicrobiia bacterium]
MVIKSNLGACITRCAAIPDTPHSEQGSFTLSNAIGAGVVLLMTVILVQGAILVYAHMVAEEAAWEGARAGAGAGTDVCRARASEVIQSMMPGVGGTEVMCGYNGDRIVVRIRADVPTMAGVIDGVVTGTASSVREDEL